MELIKKDDVDDIFAHPGAIMAMVYVMDGNVSVCKEGPIPCKHVIKPGDVMYLSGLSRFMLMSIDDTAFVCVYLLTFCNTYPAFHEVARRIAEIFEEQKHFEERFMEQMQKRFNSREFAIKEQRRLQKLQQAKLKSGKKYMNKQKMYYGL